MAFAWKISKCGEIAYLGNVQTEKAAKKAVDEYLESLRAQEKGETYSATIYMWPITFVKSASTSWRWVCQIPKEKGVQNARS